MNTLVHCALLAAPLALLLCACEPGYYQSRQYQGGYGSWPNGAQRGYGYRSEPAFVVQPGYPPQPGVLLRPAAVVQPAYSPPRSVGFQGGVHGGFGWHGPRR